MKKYIFETKKKQWEKPTEPKYVFCATAKCTVFAESLEEAKKIAVDKLTRQYLGSGIRFLDDITLLGEYELPVDWSYGYGKDRKTGTTKEIGDLKLNNVIL